MNSRTIWILVAMVTIALSAPVHAQYPQQYPSGPVPAVQEPIPYIPPQPIYPNIQRMPIQMQPAQNFSNMQNMLPSNLLRGQSIDNNQLMAQAMAMARSFLQNPGIMGSINNLGSLLDDRPTASAPMQNYDPQAMMNQIGPAIQQLMIQVQGQSGSNTQNPNLNLGDLGNLGADYLTQIDQPLAE